MNEDVDTPDLKSDGLVAAPKFNYSFDLKM
jgi:hypothetical protein